VHGGPEAGPRYWSKTKQIINISVGEYTLDLDNKIMAVLVCLESYHKVLQTR
jgi:hypothetical protein